MCDGAQKDVTVSCSIFHWVACSFPIRLFQSNLVSNLLLFQKFWRVIMNVVKNICSCWWKTYVKVSNEGNLAGFYGEILCTSACGCIFVCIFVWEFRRNLIIYGGIFIWCIVIYVYTWVICDHLFIRISTKSFE